MNAFDRQLAILKSFNFEEEAKKIVIDNKDILVEMNRQQMIDGQTNEGKDITPTHIQDPFFKTPESAKAYVRFKQKLPGIPKSSIKKPETPNLFINGFFHNSLHAVDVSSGIKIQSNIILADKITRKFKNILGVKPENRFLFGRTKVLSLLKTRFKQHTKL